MALILNNLAIVYRDQCKYVEAEALSSGAYWPSASNFGAGHLDVASALNNQWPNSVLGRKANTSEAEGAATSARWAQLREPKRVERKSPSRVARRLNRHGDASMKLVVKAGARLPIRGRQRLPSLPIELPNRRVLNGLGRSGGLVEQRASYFQRHVPI